MLVSIISRWRSQKLAMMTFVSHLASIISTPYSVLKQISGRQWLNCACIPSVVDRPPIGS